MFKVYNKNTRKASMTSFWCSYCQMWAYFTPSSNDSIVEFEQVNVSWAILKRRYYSPKLISILAFPHFEFF